MTARNVERTGSRNDLALSRSLRKIPDVRHLDLDMFQYDPRNYNIECVFEACSGLQDYTPEQKTRMARTIAKQMNAYTMLVVHAYQDDNNEHPVKIWLWNPDGSKNEIYGEECSWLEQQDICTQIHELSTTN